MNDTTIKNSEGVYPQYDALWHLDEIGVRVNGDVSAWEDLLAQNSTEDWKPVRVALIDTSVAWNHPNLKGAIDKATMIDFFASRLGSFPARHELELPAMQVNALSEEDLPGKEAALQLAQGAGAGVEALLAELLARLETPAPSQDRVLPATSPAFSAHGTAMAGLIGARPAKFLRNDPVFLGSISPLKLGATTRQVEQLITDLPTVLPYAGVNPFCSIVPISTNLEIDPEQMILALLYAALIGVDLIALPRDIADPSRFRLLAGTGLPDQAQRELLNDIHPVERVAENDQLWNELETLLRALSAQIPIVAAAGNGSDDRVIYPASISAPDNGIIAVGARAATGQPAGYSPAAALVDVFAPSGDGERLDEEIRRLDTLSTDYRAEEHSVDYVGELKTNLTSPVEASTFALQDLISTDVPGRFGYNGSDFIQNPEVETITDFGSYFCSFSGTSGAVGVAAGFLSLAFATGRVTRGASDSGSQARQFMREASDAIANDTAGPGPVAALDWSRDTGG